MSSIELQFTAPPKPSGPNGELSLGQCSDSITKQNRNISRIASLLRDMDVRVTDLEREKFIG